MATSATHSRTVSLGEAELEAALPRPPAPPVADLPPGTGDMLLNFCRAFNFITIFASILCGVALGMALVVRIHDPEKGLFVLSGQILRVYGLLLTLLLVLVELELTAFAAWWPLLESWLGRAFFQSFVAVLTFREAVGHDDTELHASLALYRALASGALMCCAGIYALGWVLCLGVIKEMRLRRSHDREKARQEYLSLDKRRAELEKLLGNEPAI